MTKPSRPDVRYNEVILGPDVSVSCGRCGDDMEWNDGHRCDRCGLDYGETLGQSPTIMDEWQHYAQQTLPEATAEKPGHLLVWPADERHEQPGRHAWLLHVGCPYGAWNGVECVLRDTVNGYDAFYSLEIAEGIPFELVDYYRDRRPIPRLLPGVYRVELTGVQLVPLRVAECLGVVDEDRGEGTHPDPDNLVALTLERAEAAFRPAGKVEPAPVTSRALRVVEAAEKYL